MYPADGQSPHIPVMLSEVMHYLKPEDNKVYVDCTFGAGGYSNAILSKADCHLYAIDCDPDVKPIANQFASKYPKFKFLEGKFSNVSELLKASKIEKVDGIVFDLGVSSMQLDNRSRGFSFMGDAELDMRMNRDGITAKYIVNNLSQDELANIIYNFGEDKDSRKIARKICLYRQTKEISTTLELAEIVRSAKPKIYTKIDQATKTFQALRIYINQELEEIKSAINQAANLLNLNGKIIVVSFHSLEDRIVKNFIRNKTGKDISFSRYDPYFKDNSASISFKDLSKGAQPPSEDEINTNPRSRSAKLRAFEKIREVECD